MHNNQIFELVYTDTKFPLTTHQSRKITAKKGKIKTYKSDLLKTAEAYWRAVIETQGTKNELASYPYSYGVSVQIYITFGTNQVKSTTPEHNIKVDVDNLSKTIIDQIVKAGIIATDRQVLSLYTTKGKRDVKQSLIQINIFKR